MKVKTPSRLHLGFIDPLGKLGRVYGSIGLAIKEPYWLIEVEKAEELSIETDDVEALRKIEGIVERAQSFLGKRLSLNISVLSSVPFHVGLGAGTQLSLAVSEAILKVEGASYTKEDVIRISGRGKRSGIGIAVYFNGGFVLDVGKRVESELPPLSLLKLDFPSDWLFLVVLPSLSLRVHDKVEEAKLNLLRDVNICEISHLILMGLLPSLVERDIRLFGEYLSLIQRKVGEIFYDAQGGVFADKVCEELIELMLKMGAYGAGQSSWGPVVYGLVERGEGALRLLEGVRDYMTSRGIQGSAWLAEANPVGREFL